MADTEHVDRREFRARFAEYLPMPNLFVIKHIGKQAGHILYPKYVFFEPSGFEGK